MTVTEKLISVLENRFHFPVYLQGTFPIDEEYPDDFFTFFIPDTEYQMRYDDRPHAADYSISLIFYSSDPMKIEKMRHKILAVLDKNGFEADGEGNSIPSDELTHTGWAIDLNYLKIKKKRG